MPIVRLHCSTSSRERRVPLTPSTPPGSPALDRPTNRLPGSQLGFSGLLHEVRQAYLETQDRPGTATLVASVAAACSAGLALAISLNPQSFLGLIRSGFLWYFGKVSNWLWAFPIVFGFASERRMPRWLAWFNVGVALVFYGWDWLPIPRDLPPMFQSGNLLVKVAYIATVAVTAVPILWRRVVQWGNAA